MVLEAAERNMAVSRVIDGKTFTGMARSVCSEIGTPAGPYADVRDLCLRVTLSGGLSDDVFWPVRELMADSASGDFVTNFVGRG